ncbi:DMT family transporter [Candidatus Lokiarchaeum ossiferum]|uniref:DMT family transporter n=1 Tax=Candidatus Lokiarchaeum ossiferum TaxID=2951803 RepID=UPI00352D0949
MEKKTKIGYGYMIVGIFTWSTIELTIKLIQNESSPITLNFFRFSVGAVILLLYALITKRTRSLVLLIKQYPKYYIPASLLGLVIGMILFAIGTTYTDASFAATIFSSNPIIISLFMILFRNEKKNKKKIIGILLGFVGVLVIVTEFQFKAILNSDFFLGNILVFFGMALWCIDVIIGKELMKKRLVLSSEEDIQIDSLDFNLVTFISATLIYIPLLFYDNQWQIITNFTWTTWIGMLYLGIITTGLGYILFFKGIDMIEASKGINLFYLKPIFATILSYFILNEEPTYFLLIGIVIEIIALLLITRE